MSIRIKDDREDKLPVWAQSQLRMLRMDLDMAERKNEILLENQLSGEETGINIVSYGMKDIHLPKDVNIRFGTDPHNYIEIHRDSRKNIQVRANNALAVRPQSSNLIYVEAVDIFS